MERSYVECDVCGERLDYGRSFQLRNRDVKGFTLDKKVTIPNLKYYNHNPTSCGSSSSPISELVIPEHVCSVVCMKARFLAWLNELPEITDTREGES